MEYMSIKGLEQAVSKVVMGSAGGTPGLTMFFCFVSFSLCLVIAHRSAALPLRHVPRCLRVGS